MTGEGEMAKYTASRFKKRDLQRIVIVGVELNSTDPVKVPGNGPVVPIFFHSFTLQRRGQHTGFEASALRRGQVGKQLGTTSEYAYTRPA